MGISLISLFMNVTWPKVGATQFTLYMAMLNFGALFGLKMAGYFEENFTYTTTIMIGGTAKACETTKLGSSRGNGCALS